MNIFESWSTKMLLNASSVWSDINGQATILSNTIYCPSEEILKSNNQALFHSSEETKFILKGFQSMGAIKIVAEYGIGRKQTPYKWAIEIISPKFYKLDSLITKQFLKKVKSSETKYFSIASPELTVPVKPKGWELSSSEPNNPRIKFHDKTIYSFPNNDSNKYRYFKYLWENYGKNVSYKSVYEFECTLKYPDKGFWKINRNIRNTINKLRKEFTDQHIHIETKKGFILTIS